MKSFYNRLNLRTAPSGSWRHTIDTCVDSIFRLQRSFRFTFKRLRRDLGSVLHGTAPRDPTLWYHIKRPFLTSWLFPAFRGDGKQAHERAWYSIQHQFLDEDEHVVLDLDYAVREGRAVGIAMIFCMGMGDYIFATSLIRALKVRHPTLPVHAYVSKNPGRNNAPQVADLLALNPDIAKITFYDGQPAAWLRHLPDPDSFKTYNYNDAIAKVPTGFLAVPVWYENSKKTPHRVTSLFETFKLPAPTPPPPPIIYLPETPAPHVLALIEALSHVEKKGIVFIQVDARSSRYQYPHADLITQALLARGYATICVSATQMADSRHFQLDLKQFSIIDSMQLLALLKQTYGGSLYVLSVASVFWSVSAGLGIANLGMQHFIDDAMHNYWYENTFVITNRDYTRLPAGRKFFAQHADYVLDERGLAVFLPDYVLDCFDRMAANVGARG